MVVAFAHILVWHVSLRDRRHSGQGPLPDVVPCLALLSLAGPTDGRVGVKRASSSQAPAEEDFPGRAVRTLGRAKDAVESLSPGQPGKALENSSRGIRLGKAVSDAGLNSVITIAGRPLAESAG